MMPRIVRYLEERRAREHRLTGALERHPAPCLILWGTGPTLLRSQPMATRLSATATAETRLLVLGDIGHFPMISARDRTARETSPASAHLGETIACPLARGRARRSPTITATLSGYVLRTTGAAMVGREPTPRSEALSEALRTSPEPFVPSRRRVIGWTLGAMAALAPVTAYQVGLLQHLPDPPVRWFDSDRVDASGEAYRPGIVPDGASGLASYAITLLLAGRGEPDRWRNRPWLPLALAGKVLFDTASAAYLTAEQISVHRRLCGWCLVAAAAVAASAPHALPEARAALRGLRG